MLSVVLAAAMVALQFPVLPGAGVSTVLAAGVEPAVIVASVEPASVAVPVVYVYDTDLASRDAFVRLLSDRGYSVTTVTVANSATMDLSRTGAVVIGSDTGSLSSWGTPSAVHNIVRSGKPVLGVGQGGYAFFGRKYGGAANTIGWGNGAHGPASGTRVVSGGDPAWTTPNATSAETGSVVALYSSANTTVSIYDPDRSSGHRYVGAESSDARYYPLVGSRDCSFLWGFSGSPTTMTASGGNVFHNVLDGLTRSCAPTYEISGTIRDTRGSAVAGVAVYASRSDGGVNVGSAVSDATGRYSLSVPNGLTYHLVFYPPAGSGLAHGVHRGQLSAATATGIPIDGANVSIDASLVPGYPASGRVTDAAGSPVPDIAVWVYLHRLAESDPMCCYFVRAARTDANGQYAIELAAGAEYKIRFAAGRSYEQWWNAQQNPANDTLTGWNAATAFVQGTTAVTGLDARLQVDRTPPMWPRGAALSTSRVGPKLVGLSWPAAADPSGPVLVTDIAPPPPSYRVYQNDVLRATVGPGDTSYRAGSLTSNTTYTFRVDACDAAANCARGPSTTITTPIGYGNYTWSKAHPLTPGMPVDQHLFLEGLSAWFKVPVKPDQRVEVNLTNLPADYDLLVFRDIAAVHRQMRANPNQRQSTAEVLEMGVIEMGVIEMGVIEMGTIEMGVIDMGTIEMGVIEMGVIEMGTIEMGLIEMGVIDMGLIDMGLIDMGLIEMGVIEMGTIEHALVQESGSSAPLRSLLAAATRTGTANERIARFTFDQSGDFYIRVRGKKGAYSLAAPFRLQANVQTGLCEGITPISTPPGATLLTGSGTAHRTLIVADPERTAGSAAERSALRTKLAAYAARSEVGGVVVDVSEDARVQAAHTQAAANVACPYAQNVIATEIKRIVDSYRATNPITNVVLVGPDSAIPFWRHVDPPFGPERNYVPPVRHETASEAALRKSLYLSQDRYGSHYEVQRGSQAIPIQDIGVSRVLETAAEVNAQLDAYAQLAAGRIPVPRSALITGYDLLIDFAQLVDQEIRAGLGAGSVVDSALIGNQWTSDQLRQKIVNERYDLLSVGGHFSAFSTIGPDEVLAARLRSTEVLDSPVDMRWAIFATPGCHSGYNVPDAHAIPNVTPEPDWAQVAARKGFILVAGTGYQYGDTTLPEYSERLYIEFWKQLRTGTGAVSTTTALLDAKKAYRLAPMVAEEHVKVLLQVAHFGLPVLVDLPGARLPRIAETPLVPATTPVTGPGASFGLTRADSGTLSFAPSSAELPVRLTGATSDTAASYLTGASGRLINPFQPVLPLETRNATVLNTILRGVGFRGGAYTDTEGLLPLTSTPGTELGGPMVPFASDVFYPLRPWGASALETLAGGPARLFVTPVQHRSATPGSTSIVRRQIHNADFRLFYSAYSGDLATSAAHALESVTTTVAAGGVAFQAFVTGERRVGAQEVWVTYTATSGPLAGQWRSFDLARDGSGPAPGREGWTGTLALPAGQDPAAVRYFVQVANGLGLVSMATNGGAYYALGPAPQRVATSLALQSPTVAISNQYGGSVTARAALTSAGSAVAGVSITFELGGQRVRATTDAAGIATAAVGLYRLPGTYELRATFGGSDTLLASQSTSVPVTITKRSTSIALSPASSAAGQYSDAASPVLVATLTEASPRALPLAEQTIYWVVSGADAAGTPRYLATTSITDRLGRAELRIERIALPAGTYTVAAHFGGAVPQESGPPLVLSHAVYQASTQHGSLVVSPEDASLTYTGDTVIAVGSVLNASAIVSQTADGTPGDLTMSRVRFDVKQNGALIATQTVPVAADGRASASFANLSTNVYLVEVALLGGGYFAAAPVRTLLAVHDRSAGFVTGGGWLASPAGACTLNAACRTATGKVEWGLAAKYAPRAVRPSGETEFAFEAGGLSFASTSYDWLVVTGARATVRGSGQISEQGDYGFLFTVIDGRAPGGGGTDRFRIKIWDKATGDVVYDNERGASDDSDRATPIRGGRITIHRR